MSRYFRAKVLHNVPLNETNYILAVKALSKTARPEPGQFYMIEAGSGSGYDPLLKRPFSFFRKKADTLEFLYTVRGKGTSLLRNTRKATLLNIIGPLGKGYPRSERGFAPLFVAGGTGIASIYPLLEKRSKKACVFYGARCEKDLLFLEDLKRMEKECFICTDDGSCGYRGTAVDSLVDFFNANAHRAHRAILYACGPVPMLRKVAETALYYGVRGYVSLEEHMACGIGACLGCAVKTIDGYQRVCREGPVFPIEKIVW